MVAQSEQVSGIALCPRCPPGSMGKGGFAYIATVQIGPIHHSLDPLDERQGLARFLPGIC